MSEKITIIDKEHSENADSQYLKPSIGPRTMGFMNRQDKLEDEGKLIIIDEALNILRHCLVPGYKGNITNLAVGYIQSGKTLSYETLSNLAADNGYRIIIYFTGITTMLGKQTYSRISSDLQANNSEDYAIFQDKGKFDSADASLLKKFLLYSKDTTLLFPIMKHYTHIGSLAEMFKNPLLKSLLSKIGVFIIDDEADQASFNTYARKNAKNSEWENDEFSKTYASILRLRANFPSFSYIQYTATPQAALLIDGNDALSPKFYTVLSPGKGYTGGKFFFKEKQYSLIKTIPDDEVYNKRKNRLETCPNSLISALRQFVISVAIAVFIEKKIGYLTMMVHPDGYNESNEKFYTWVQYLIDEWLAPLNNEGDPAREVLINEFKDDYEEMTKYLQDRPSFGDVIKRLPQVLLRTNLHLVQSGSNIDVKPENDIEWENAPSHILVGANILNRGFTVEHLSMTYMPRTSQGKATADTIEQRCRFFGYKMKYIQFCRIYLSAKGKKEFEDYVDHEEMLREKLGQGNTCEDFTRRVSSMAISDGLTPTRTNILSKKLIHGKMIGWRTLGSLSHIEDNKKRIEGLLTNLQGKYTEANPEQSNLVRKHRYVRIDIDDFISFFRTIEYDELPNLTRKVVTLQYLSYLKKEKKCDFVYFFEMSYALEKENWRERMFKDGKPVNLMMGHDPKNSLPADDTFKYEDAITFQLHHIRIKNEGWDKGKDLYNFTVYYPASFEQGFVAIDQEDEEDEE